MIINAWKNTKSVCKFCNQEMLLDVGKTIRYKCPSCKNSISEIQFEKMLDKISELDNQKFLNKEIGDLKGSKITIGKSIVCEIIEDSQDGKFTVSIQNLEGSN